MYTYDSNIEQQVLALLRWNQEEYNDLVLNEGIAYINRLVPDYPEVKKQILKNKIFWNWWRNHWQQRDQQFLEECEGWYTTLEKYRLVYANHNDGATLAAALYLNGQVLEQSYAELMQQIIKKQKEAA